MKQPELAAQLDTLIEAIRRLQSEMAEVRKENQQLRVDLLKHTATGWQDPLTVGRALGFTGADASIVKKMHRYRGQYFNKLGRHYRIVGGSERPTYQYNIEACNKALSKGVS